MTAASAAPHRVAIHVCGSVAAYRACDVITSLRKQDCEVRVAMTRSARHFITETTLQSLSGHPVACSVWQATSGGHGMGHIDLAGWAEVHTVVAGSANLIARLAHGFADDAVTTALLASRTPLIIAPAMESAMWEHLATRANVETLRSRGVTFVGPVRGRLASGAEGEGRMADVDQVVAAIRAALAMPRPE
ncbi:MAG TPA: flavoprotein [Candidatus Deferrimicrobium sp.]|nr:flavoprotein [Candidatus Deferrimicrobium sp.]